MGYYSRKIAAVFFVCAVVFFAQNADAQQAGVSGDDTAINNTQQIQNQQNQIDETSIILTDSTSEQPSSSSVASTVFMLLRMVVVLAIVAACIYFVIWFMKRGLRVSNNSDPFLRVVSTINLSQGKTVSVVTLLDHAYIIGVTDNAVNLIGEVTDKELVDAMNLYSDKETQTTKPRSFSDVLSIFMPNGPRDESRDSSGRTKRTDEKVFQGNADLAQEILKRQRDKLQNGG